MATVPTYAPAETDRYLAAMEAVREAREQLLAATKTITLSDYIALMDSGASHGSIQFEIEYQGANYPLFHAERSSNTHFVRVWVMDTLHEKHSVLLGSFSCDSPVFACL